MRTGRPKKVIILSKEEEEQLKSITGSRSLPYGLVTRARIIIMAAEGATNKAIAEKIEYSPQSVGLWRRRFLEQGIQGLHDELRPGRPRSISDEQVAELVRKTLQTKPEGRTHWTTRSMAGETQISRPTVQRIWNAFGLQPHRQRHFKISTDPFFVEKVRDIVGLYLNPPDKAMVLCVDEKSQVQALDRTQPLLPMGLGYVEGVTHDYVRHGTTTLFAALDIATGKVLTQCRHRHRHQEYLSFLKHIDTNVPEDLDIHFVVDNYSTHKHPRVKRWLAVHPRYHVHFTPTYSSWLNQVEIWFNRITQQAIRRGTFRSVKELVAKIDQFVQHYNANTNPFVWTATADSILDKIKRLCQVISETQH
ncbi:MAG: IS630 family transposase [Candidatus Aminicenantes bacterium]|nr:IS630 family transposase [Candidatus Aminicenantes bacterium]